MNALRINELNYIVKTNTGFVNIHTSNRISEEFADFIAEAVTDTKINSVVVNYDLYRDVSTPIEKNIKYRKGHEERITINLRGLLTKFIKDDLKRTELRTLDLINKFGEFVKEEVWKFIHGNKNHCIKGYIFETNSANDQDIIDYLLFKIEMSLGINNDFPKDVNITRESKIEEWNCLYSFDNKIINVITQFDTSYGSVVDIARLLKHAGKHEINTVKILDNFELSKKIQIPRFQFVTEKGGVNGLEINLGVIFKELLKKKSELIKGSHEEMCNALREEFYRELKVFLFGEEKYKEIYYSFGFNNLDGKLALMMHEAIKYMQK